MKPTRYYSKNQEKRVAKIMGGKVQPNSGATAFYKGDVITNQFLIECKTKTKEAKSVTIKKDWLLKNAEEAFDIGKLYNALAFDFGDGENYYIIDEKTFILLCELLKGEN